MKMDHHCPWVGNCVGQNNIKFFLQFVLYVLVGGVYSFSLFVYKAGFCYYNKDRSVRGCLLRRAAVLL